MPQTTSTYPDLFRFLRKESRGPKIRIVTMSLVSGAARMMMLIAINTAAARASEHKSLDLVLLAEFCACLLIHALAGYDAGYQASKMSSSMVRRLRLRLCEKLLFARLEFLEGQNRGNVYAQISYDIGRLSEAAMAMISASQAAILVLCGFAYLGWLSPIGLCLAAATVFAGAATYYWLDRKTIVFVDLTRKREALFFDGLQDILGGFKEIKLRRSRHVGIFAHLSSVTRDHQDSFLTLQRLTLFISLLSEACTYSLLGVLIFLLPFVFSGGAISIFQFLSTVLFIIGPVESLVSAFLTVSRSRVSLRNVETLEASLSSGLETNREPSITPLSFDKIRLENLHFQFRGKEKDQRFDVGPVNLDIRRGEIMFILGGNGAGKTTLLKLIAGLYEPNEGRILVNGHELDASEIQAYREMFAVVFSDFHLFRRLYDIESFDLSTLDDVLKELQIDHKTRLNGDLFSTVNLSSGQRKRLSYAISRISDRQIYVFDEFASDQDPGFRRFFYLELLPRLKRDGKTVVAVTHDDRWFDVADRVVKMEYGQIVEQQTT